MVLLFGVNNKLLTTVAERVQRIRIGFFVSLVFFLGASRAVFRGSYGVLLCRAADYKELEIFFVFSIPRF